ncbi:MAG: HNH endonuclease [Pyrinomonadaceae bacterium]
MQCIFCKIDSTESCSVEHIIPESLGNLSHVLPPGVVCDKCNNYFATKVEKPFLETDAMRHMRYDQAIPNKRGRVPIVEGIVLPDYPAVLQKFTNSNLAGIISLDEVGAKHILATKGAKLILPLASDPPARLVSRFLAKAAIEAMAARFSRNEEWLASFAAETQLDPIRHHARRGEPADWPFHVRRIYNMDAKWLDEDGEPIQLVHEFDIVKTDWDEWFFILALFGLELAINYGGPEIGGYQRWLTENRGRSPLYSGKNSFMLRFVG